MMTAIRKSIRPFIAVVVLIVFAGVISFYIFQKQRLRIPVLEEKPFQFQAEFDNAQGVVAGQGQTLRVAGVRIGDVSEVELVDGRAVVTFDVDREYLPIYEDATILMRPLTGLRDMFFSIDPGTRSAAGGEIEEGDTVPLANTAPDVPLDQVLEALDSDNQAYLRAILVGAGQGLEGRGKDLGRDPRQPGTDQPRPREAQHRGRRARREPEPPGPQPLDPHEVDRDAGPGHRSPRGGVEPDAGGDGAGGPGHPERDGTPAWRPGRDARCARGCQGVRRRGRSGVRVAAAVRAQPAGAQLLDAEARRDRDARDPRRAAPVRSCGARADPRPEPGSRQALEDGSGPQDDRDEAEPPRQHGRLQPARQGASRYRGPRRGLPLLGRLAGP